MGYGDALIAAGQAQSLYDEDPSQGPIALVDVNGAPRWNPIWQGNPVIWVPGGTPVPSRSVVSGRGALPYLRYPYSAETGWTFTDYRVRDHRGRLYLTDEELDWGRRLRANCGPYLVLEPTAQRKHPNRRPPVTFWPALRLHLKAAYSNPPIIQPMHSDADGLRGVLHVPHTTFREACGILSGASLLICTEGGLAHAAAALGIPAVVLWGGNISSDVLGYPEHANLVSDHPRTPCGSLVLCHHCASAWDELTTDAVIHAAERLCPTRSLR